MSDNKTPWKPAEPRSILAQGPWLGGDDPEAMLREVRLVINAGVSRGLRGYVLSACETSYQSRKSANLWAAGDSRAIPHYTWEWAAREAEHVFLANDPSAASFPKDSTEIGYFRRLGIANLDPHQAAFNATVSCAVGLPLAALADLLRDSIGAWPGPEDRSGNPWLHFRHPHVAVNAALDGHVHPEDVDRALMAHATARGLGRGKADRAQDPDPRAMSQLGDLLESRGVSDAVILNHLRGKECCPICVGACRPAHSSPPSEFCMGCHHGGGWRFPVCRSCTGEGCSSCSHSGKVPYRHGPGCWAADALSRWYSKEQVT